MRFGQSVHTNTRTVFENALESGSKRKENAHLHIVEAMWTVQNGTVNQTPTWPPNVKDVNKNTEKIIFFPKYNQPQNTNKGHEQS